MCSSRLHCDGCHRLRRHQPRRDVLCSLPRGAARAGGSAARERIVDADEYGELTRLLEEADAGRLVSGGGQAANTLCVLARLGFRTAIIGSVDMVAGAGEMFEHVRLLSLPAFVVSASYRQFAHAVAERVRLPIYNVYCTG